MCKKLYKNFIVNCETKQLIKSLVLNIYWLIVTEIKLA